MLSSGFYALEIKQLQRRHIIERPSKTVSVLEFMRMLKHSNSLPKKVLVVGLDRMLYLTFRMYQEGEKGKQAVKQTIKVLSHTLNKAQVRKRLLKERPTVFFALEYIEHARRWQAGVRIRPKDEPLELFQLENFFRRCEVEEIGTEIICYSRF